MRFTTALVAATGLLGGLAAGAATPEAEELMLDLNEQALKALEDAEDAEGPEKRSDRQCSVLGAAVRRDWALLSGNDRRDYTRAVKCLFDTPSKLKQTNPDEYEGVVNRYDDFVATHINLTMTIHGTGNFLTWHRYYVWAYETALREECGYRGYQPYWNWFAHTDNPTRSPVFDGSSTSIGGDGAFTGHNGTASIIGHIPPGNGGGCISGPLSDVQLNIGPVMPEMDGLEDNPGGPYAPNPRCIRRDLSSWVLTRWMTAPNLLNITVGRSSGTIKQFQDELQGRFDDGFMGMHTAGHVGVGGESGSLFSSPNDPSFFLHHAMVDRVYWIWQALHPRQANEIAGTITVLNNPPSRDAVVEDPLIMNPHAPTRMIKDLLNTLGGTPLCYIYL